MGSDYDSVLNRLMLRLATRQRFILVMLHVIIFGVGIVMRVLSWFSRGRQPLS